MIWHAIFFYALDVCVYVCVYDILQILHPLTLNESKQSTKLSFAHSQSISIFFKQQS